MVNGKYAHEFEQSKVLFDVAERMFKNATEPEFIDAAIYLMKAYESLADAFIKLNLASEKAKAEIETSAVESFLSRIGGALDVYAKKIRA